MIRILWRYKYIFFIVIFVSFLLSLLNLRNLKIFYDTERIIELSNESKDVIDRSLDDQNKLYKPEKAQYKITFIPENPMNSLQWQTPGKVKLLTNNHSFFSAIYNKLLKILIRESGF